MPGRFWKWRMHGSAVTLAEQFLNLTITPDLIIASDMCELSLFQALTKKITHNIPFVVYFHESQLTYPFHDLDTDKINKRDHHYSFINISSALSADKVIFNSYYHQDEFLRQSKLLLSSMPDFQELASVNKIQSKSSVLPIGIDFKKFDQIQSDELNKYPLILWNHRWEYDKNPDDFFHILLSLKQKGVKFNLCVLGEHGKKYPEIFDKIKLSLAEEIVHWGTVSSTNEYIRWLKRSDILPVTSNQDFFGISIVEAIYCQCYPLLPDRLSYREHIPEELQKNVLYSSYDKLLTALEAVSNEGPKKSDLLAMSDFVRKYDWVELMKEYNNLFQNIDIR